MTFRRVTAGYVYDGSAWRPLVAGGDPGPGPSAPTTPTGLDYTATSSSITLSWDPSTPGTGDGIDRYEVRRGGTLRGSSFGLTFTDSGLPASTPYTYEVRAIADSTLVSAWSAPLAAQTSGAPPTTATKCGWHVEAGDGGVSPWSSAFSASVALLGYPRVYRTFKTGGTLPTSWSSWPAPNDADVLFVVSWKPDQSTLLAGGLDSTINTFLNWCHNNQYHTRLATWHEYDVKGMNAASFKSQWTYVANKVREFNSPYVQNALINGGYKAASVQATYLPNDLSLIDVFASDPYAIGQPVADKTTYNGGRKVIDLYHYDFKSNYLPASVKSGIAELGWHTGYGTAAQGAAWYRGAFDRSIEIGAEFVAMYNHDAAYDNTLIGSRQPTFAATAAAVKQYVDASPLGFA